MQDDALRRPKRRRAPKLTAEQQKKIGKAWLVHRARIAEWFAARQSGTAGAMPRVEYEHIAHSTEWAVYACDVQQVKQYWQTFGKTIAQLRPDLVRPMMRARAMHNRAYDCQSAKHTYQHTARPHAPHGTPSQVQPLPVADDD